MVIRSQVVPALTNVFSKALKDGVSNVSFSTLSADLGQTMYEYSFRIPPYYTLLVRSLSVLEVHPFSVLQSHIPCYNTCMTLA
jgi:aarF domain-containing kinase